MQSEAAGMENIPKAVDYKSYEGNWSVDGITHENVIADGGRLPTAAAMGKFAAWRIIQKKNKINQ